MLWYLAGGVIGMILYVVVGVIVVAEILYELHGPKNLDEMPAEWVIFFLVMTWPLLIPILGIVKLKNFLGGRI